MNHLLPLQGVLGWPINSFILRLEGTKQRVVFVPVELDTGDVIDWLNDIDGVFIPVRVKRISLIPSL